MGIRSLTGISHGHSAATFSDTVSLNFGASNTTKYLSVASNSSFNLGSAMTVSAWVKYSAADQETVVAKFGASSSQRSWLMGSDVTSPTKMQVEVSGDGTSTGAFKNYTTSITVFDGNWHHIAFTFGSSTLLIYVDGVLDSSPTKTTDNAVTSIFNSTTPFSIGTAFTSPPTLTRVYSGKVDEVSIWNIALSATDITNIYNSGTPTNLTTHAQAASIVSWWRLGDVTDTPTTVKDRIGTNHLTGTGLADSNFTPDVPVFKSIESISLTAASSQYITFGNVLNFGYVNPFSFSIWYKPASLSGGDHYIITKMSGSSPYPGYQFEHVAGTLYFSLESSYPSDAIVISAPSGMSTGNWYNLTVTYSGNGNASGFAIYVNGVSKTISTINNSHTTGVISNTTGLQIGALNGGGFLDGLIDDVSIWNTALSSSNVTDLYNSGTPKNMTAVSYSSGLVSYWRMEGNTNDSVGTNNGTTVNSPTFSTDVP